jgi:hypothetical protein
MELKPGLTEKEKEDLDSVTYGYDHGVFLSLKISKTFIRYIDDLKMLLVAAPRGSGFITSDNPVALYNQYCEGVQGMGVVGANNTGLQIFVPLSPSLLFIFYDGAIYRTLNEGPNGVVAEISSSDVDQLNLFQVVNAEENLLFNDTTPVNYVKRLVRGGAKFRLTQSPQVHEYVQEGHPEAPSLLALHEQSPNLGLDLSFMRIKKNARGRPLVQRLNRFRRPLADDYPKQEKETDIKPGTRFFRKDSDKGTLIYKGNESQKQ